MGPWVVVVAAAVGPWSVEAEGRRVLLPCFCLYSFALCLSGGLDG